ncbi:contact-dependent growth inhibition system immunity protein [Pantoea cypripedii]|uniref:CdiI immunity protein domain-containing protein n=1 Tax=Pantoea cypripedii TaxID=55209 RepID=A0A6B9G5Q0_PANCY|nr:contact-dependent growth inhibition system immunity protein [Pantoea cypripedii]QGY33051.1 hypothetical protein CUN67_29440 [Pantoea cypripedii]
MTTTYPRIEKMMAGYINMDAYEMTGSEDRAEQVLYYTTRVSPKALKDLLSELDEFEREHSDNLTDDFEDAFDFGAYIPDARVFFGLVREVVRAQLGEALPEAQEHCPLSESMDKWLLNVSYNALPNGAVLYVGEGVDLFGIPPNADGLVFHTGAGIFTEKPAELKQPHQVTTGGHFTLSVQDIELIRTYERELIVHALNIPRSERATKEYVRLLESILTVKGVAVGQDQTKQAFGFSVEDFIRAQESKTTR